MPKFLRHFRREILLPFACFVLLCGIAVTGNAQVTTSSLSGVITDGSQPLPGATVRAVHEPSGSEYGALTSVDGHFNIPNMRVGGPYAIEISFVGYQTVKYADIYLKLGEPYEIKVKLSETASQLGEVVVSTDRVSELNVSKTGASTNISSRQVSVLPTLSRNITDFTRLTPQANGSSFGGRDARYNNVQIDGANFNNGFGLSSEPLPGGGSPPISLDAIEELQVNIAPYDVRQSGFSGAGINAVTRSGTNTFTGSAYIFYRNQDLTGYKVRDLEITKPDETSTTTYGLRLGGPIIKNKLFFFVSGERVENKGNNTAAVNLWKASDDGVGDANANISRTSKADLEAVRNHLINVWHYDPGKYEGYANDNGSTSNTLLGRLDWNINSKHKLSIRYNQSENVLPSLVNGNSGPYPRSTSANRVSALSMAFEKTMYDTKNIVKSVSAELTSSISSKLSNQLLITYSRIQATRSSKSEEFPFVDIGDGTGSITAPESYVNYMSFGYELFTYGNDVKNDNYIITDNLTYVTGKHTFTGGVSFESQKFGNQYMRLGTSYYRYASVADFLTTGTPGEVAPIQFGVTYPYQGRDTYAPIKYGLPAIYVQDKFSTSENLELTVGLRAEMPWFMNDLTPNLAINALQLLDPSGEPRTYNTGSWPKTRVMLSPRVGLRWDAMGDKSLILRGGTGIFAGRVPFVWLTNMPSNSGVIQNNVEPGSYAASSAWINDIRFKTDKYYWVNNPPASAANVFIKNPTGGLPTSFALVDDNFKMPQIWRTSVGADYTIPNMPLIASADVLYTKDLQGVYQFGANRAPATQHLNYLNDHRDYWPGGAGLKYNNAVAANTGTVLANTTKGYSVSATAGVSLQPTAGFSGSLYYTYTLSKTPNDNPGSNASSAWGGSPAVNSPNDLTLYNSQSAVPHHIVANVSYHIEYAKHFGTTVSLFYNGSNQGRFSFTYTGDINGDALTDLLYVPNKASELNFEQFTTNGVTFTVEQQQAAFDKFVNNNKFLKDSRGGYADRNGALLPWLNRFDFRLLQDLYTNIGKNKHTLQLSVDIFNIGNLISKDWGTLKALNGAQSLLRVSTISPEGVPTVRMNTIQQNGETILPATAFRDVTALTDFNLVTGNTNYNTWSMQIGLRYSF